MKNSKETYEKIKAKVGSKWAFIVNPEYDLINSVDFIKGTLIYYASDRKEVIDYSLEWRKKHKVKSSTMVYMGERPDLILML